MADDDTTKLIIFGLGIAAIALVAYLIFRQQSPYMTYNYPVHQPSPTPSLSQPQQTLSTEDLQALTEQKLSLSLIEQKLLNLENKFDNFSIKTEPRNTVSLKPQPQSPVQSVQPVQHVPIIRKMDEKSRRDYYGMS